MEIGEPLIDVPAQHPAVGVVIGERAEHHRLGLQIF
jgi:hypothetical protein